MKFNKGDHVVLYQHHSWHTWGPGYIESVLMHDNGEYIYCVQFKTHWHYIYGKHLMLDKNHYLEKFQKTL